MKRILIIEDNPADVFLMKEALRGAGLTDLVLEIAEDGEEALSRLKGLHTAQNWSLVILDLNLPKGGGAEILEVIRGDPKLSHTLVVTWTSSVAPREREQLLGLGVDEHLVKPMRLEEYIRIGAILRDLIESRQPASPAVS
jgi:CheY-like chemotaxis protein